MGDIRNAELFPNARPWRGKPILTKRQVQCVEALICGEKVPEIARALGCCKQNVNEVLRDAIWRTGLRTREQLVAWWAVAHNSQTFSRRFAA